MEYDSEGRLKNIRELTDDEYNQTYAEGEGGHELPPDVLDELNDEGDENG